MIDKLAVVYYKDGSSGRVVIEDVPTIDAALVRLVGEGEHQFLDDASRDSVVRMTALNGSQLVMLASFMVGYSLSTRENRRRRVLDDAAIDAENPDTKEPTQAPAKAETGSSP